MKIKALIFDMGGILIDLDYDQVLFALEKLGATNASQVYTQSHQKDYVGSFEVGAITKKEFLRLLRNDLIGLRKDVTDEQLMEAWSALLLGFQKDKFKLVKGFHDQGYKTFLFSNIDEITYEGVSNRCREYGVWQDFETVFDDRYFSHLFGYSKPYANSFRALAEAIKQKYQINADEILFIDDTKKHIHGPENHPEEGAIAAGIHGLHVNSNLSADELRKLIMDKLKLLNST